MTIMRAAPTALEQPSARLFTVEEYHRMAESGVIGPEERTELLEGKVCSMAPSGPLHASRVDRVARIFFRQFSDRAQVRNQNPVTLGKMSEPQPDIALLRLREDEYESRHPSEDDILLGIEVAVSSLRFDLGAKAEIYARNGLTELWVADVENERLIVLRAPGATGYTERIVLEAGDQIAPQAFPNDLLDVAQLLKSRRTSR